MVILPLSAANTRVLSFSEAASDPPSDEDPHPARIKASDTAPTRPEVLRMDIDYSSKFR